MSGSPKVGDKAPDFRMYNQSGELVSLNDFRNKKNVILYFYPKDDTPGCTKEACNFRDQLPSFEGLDAVILGVSVDNVESHKKFVEKYNLTFPLLSDDAKSISRLYGTLNEKGYNNRMTFVIDKQGIIRAVFPKVQVDGHWEEVKKTLEGLNASLTK